MRFRTDQNVKERRIVLAVFEALKAVERDGFLDRALRAKAAVEQERMAPEPRSLAENRLGGNPELACDLPRAGTGDEAHEDRRQEIGTFQPVVGPEGLTAEISTAGVAPPTLDAARQSLSDEESGTNKTP
jgi:hypothetical protein